MTSQNDPARMRQAAAQLTAGAVLRFFSIRARKVKMHVLIAAMADRSLGFFVNTKPAPFIVRNPDLLRRQVDLPRATHPFLTYDSSLGCHDVDRLPPARELAEGLVEGDIELLGKLDRSVYSVVISAATGSPLIAMRDQGLITRAFKGSP